MSWVLDAGWWLVDYVITYVKNNPLQALIVAVIILRLFGTTVQTGWKGVLFSLGRVRRELEPGFHALIPFVQRVRKIPVRSITMHLPMQRITTADGLVFDVQANLVYRIVDATRALVQIGDIRKGIEAVLLVVIQDLLRDQTRGQLQDRKAMDEEFTVRAKSKLERWGATVEQAGFMTIAPTSRTLRLTQLGLLTRERARMVRRYLDAGLSAELAATLLGADRKVCAHASVRYRARTRREATLRKAILKTFLSQERQHVVQELLKLGLSHEQVVAQAAAADPAVAQRAAVRARLASRESAALRRHHAATASLAPVQPTLSDLMSTASETD
jgi:regulator of protease activity HflC (stomatin/prohibitin superfamily)